MSDIYAGDKFGRNYQVFIGTSNGLTLEIQLPFTIEFDISKHQLASANVCQIRLYNLSEYNRQQIQYNAFNQSDFRSVILNVGYGNISSLTNLTGVSSFNNQLTQIFSGNISQAWSVREHVNYITQIECYDGGYANVNGQIPNGFTFPKGTPLKTVITALMATLIPYQITPGPVGNFLQILGKDETYSGNIVQVLNEITGGAFFINDGIAYALQSSEFVPDPNLTYINTDTGLLGTPTLEQSTGRFSMLFEPNLKVGSNIFLESETNVNLNGIQKITALKHRGTISGAVCGDLITTVEFTYSSVPVPVPI